MYRKTRLGLLKKPLRHPSESEPARLQRTKKLRTLSLKDKLKALRNLILKQRVKQINKKLRRRIQRKVKRCQLRRSLVNRYLPINIPFKEIIVVLCVNSSRETIHPRDTNAPNFPGVSQKTKVKSVLGKLGK